MTGAGVRGRKGGSGLSPETMSELGDHAWLATPFFTPDSAAGYFIGPCGTRGPFGRPGLALALQEQGGKGEGRGGGFWLQVRVGGRPVGQPEFH